MKTKMQELLAERAALDLKISALAADILTTNDGSLDERWDTWLSIAKSGALSRGSWVCNSNKILGLEWYDDFYYERHEDVDYADVYERILEGFGYGDKQKVVDQDKIDEWREWIMKNNKEGFTLDW